MEKLTFKTNIMCMGCIATFTPFIQDKPGVKSWNVDITKQDKTLTVEGDLSKAELEGIVKEAGFKVLD